MKWKWLHRVLNWNNAGGRQNWRELASSTVELGCVRWSPVCPGPGRPFQRKDEEENTTQKASFKRMGSNCRNDDHYYLAWHFEIHFRRERNLRVHGIGMAQPFGQGQDTEASFLCLCGRSTGQAAHCSSCSPFLLFGVMAVAVAILSLAFLAVNLQSQIASVSMHLEAGKSS